MAVKILRQPRKIAIIGAPTSAAVLTPGHERAPAALRAAGIVDRLRAAGFDVTDMGDVKTQISQPDNQHPRARNIPPLIAALNELRPHVEVAVKSGALPLILGGDCSIVLATVAGARRYYRHVGLIYVDRDADMNVPASTPSGCVDGMVVSHLIGRGAPELIRFWGEPPLVREPDIVLFGVDRLDAPEKIALDRTPIRRYLGEDIRRTGVTAAAESAVARMQGGSTRICFAFGCGRDCQQRFQRCNICRYRWRRYEPCGYSEGDGNFRRASKHGRAGSVHIYPTLDPDGSGAKVLVELLVGILTVRLAALETPAELAAEANYPVSVAPPAPSQVVPTVPEPSTEVSATTSEPETTEPSSESSDA